MQCGAIVVVLPEDVVGVLAVVMASFLNRRHQRQQCYSPEMARARKMEDPSLPWDDVCS